MQAHRCRTGPVEEPQQHADPQTGQFTQTDPIGLAGGLNLYGYAGGDPINFHDPFGLTMIARGDANYRARVRRSIQWLAIRSPTFRQAMEAMQADGFRVYISEAGACAGMGRCVRRTGRRSVAVTFPLSDLGPSRSATDWSLADGFHLAHELMHAAGHLSEFIGENSGVPADCAKRDADSPCAERMTARIEREVREYNRAEKEREDP